MIRLIIASILIIFGLVIFTLSTLGNFRYNFVLNRMQASAISDTLATSSILLALIIISGFTLSSLKLAVVIVFLWIANPVATHFLAKTEILVNKDIENECEVVHHENN